MTWEVMIRRVKDGDLDENGEEKGKKGDKKGWVLKKKAYLR